MTRDTTILDGVRVLVVDDDEDTCDLFATMLRRAGAEVRTASDADHALRAAAAWRPSVVISDLSIPMTDVPLMLRELRALHAPDRIPAIAVSGHALERDRRDARAAGFDEHAAKPVDMRDLVMLVARWASGAGGS